jgi:alkaline phosphatase
MTRNACVAAALVLLSGCSSQPARDDGARLLPRVAIPAIARPDGETAAWWFRAGAATAANAGAGREQARNIILFLGDGMSLPTVAAARILEGQRAGQPGEEHRLAFEEFPYTALSRTYNTDSQVPDSAGTMTALTTGAKARLGAIAVGQQVARGDCAGRGDELATLLEIAEAAGLSTGVVTTTRLTHATPAATYAHASDREWESDADLARRSPAAAAKGCRDIARQFVEFPDGDGIDVALAGGRRKFQTVDEADPEYPGLRGLRTDGRDLVAEWRGAHPEGKYVWNATQLQALDLSRETRLLGLFEPDHMQYEHDRAKDAAGEPSLAEMTRAAITVLRRNPKGFFLMVEGGRIDHAHHAGNAFRALDETIAFCDAVRAARAASPAADTLIVVTADHSHTMTFAGYGRRGNPILGKVSGSSGEERGQALAKDSLGLPYTALGYANGPGYTGATREQAAGPKRFPHVNAGAQPVTGRPDLRDVDTDDPDYLQEATLPMGSETHGGDDVGVWAIGPGASALHGSIEENVVFHLMLQSQPRLVKLLCGLGDCEAGVPLRLPAEDALRAQAR